MTNNWWDSEFYRRIQELENENAELRANQIAGRCGDCWAAQEGEIFTGYCRYSDADVTELGYCHEWGKAK